MIWYRSQDLGTDISPLVLIPGMLVPISDGIDLKAGHAIGRKIVRSVAYGIGRRLGSDKQRGKLRPIPGYSRSVATVRPRPEEVRSVALHLLRKTEDGDLWTN